jgi:hypothetical protein
VAQGAGTHRLVRLDRVRGHHAIVLGLFHGLMGLLAIFSEEDYYAVGEKGLMISVDYSAWGWVHLASAS